MEEARQAKGIDNTKGKERDTREPDNDQRKRGEATNDKKKKTLIREASTGHRSNKHGIFILKIISKYKPVYS